MHNISIFLSRSSIPQVNLNSDSWSSAKHAPSLLTLTSIEGDTASPRTPTMKKFPLLSSSTSGTDRTVANPQGDKASQNAPPSTVSDGQEFDSVTATSGGAHLNEALWPAWITDAIPHLRKMSTSLWWALLLRKWLELEHSLGFPAGHVSFFNAHRLYFQRTYTVLGEEIYTSQ